MADAAANAASVAVKASAWAFKFASKASFEACTVSRFLVYKYQFRDLPPICEGDERDKSSQHMHSVTNAGQVLIINGRPSQQQHVIEVASHQGCAPDKGFLSRHLRKECARLTGVRHAFARKPPSQNRNTRQSDCSKQARMHQHITEKDLRKCHKCKRKYLYKRALKMERLGRPLKPHERAAIFEKMAKKHSKHASSNRGKQRRS